MKLYASFDFYMSWFNMVAQVAQDLILDLGSISAVATSSEAKARI